MPNPGRMGLGAVITEPDGTRHALSKATHTIGCNNEAELGALTYGLEAAKALGATDLHAHTDNAVLVEQLGARTATAVKPIARLATLFADARALLTKIAAGDATHPLTKDAAASLKRLQK